MLQAARSTGHLPKKELLAGPLVPLSCYGARTGAGRNASPGPGRDGLRGDARRPRRLGRNRGPRGPRRRRDPKGSGERLLTPAGTSFYVRRAGVAIRATGRARGGTPAPTPEAPAVARRRRRSAARRPRMPGAFYVRPRARPHTTRRWHRPRHPKRPRRTGPAPFQRRRTTGRGGRRPVSGAARARTGRSSRAPPAGPRGRSVDPI